MIKLDNLKKTQSYKSGLISVQEINARQSKTWGANKSPLTQAEADKTKQYILLLNTNKELHTPRFFINSPVSLEFNNQADEMVVVSVKTTPMSFSISAPTLPPPASSAPASSVAASSAPTSPAPASSAPASSAPASSAPASSAPTSPAPASSAPASPSGYPLQGSQINVDAVITASFCAQDIEKLWLLWEDNQDPLDVLKACIEAKSKRYFDNIELGDLLDPFDLIQVRQSSILKQAAKKAATNLEDVLMKTQVDGLSVVDIDVDAVIPANPDITPQLTKLKTDFKITDDMLEPLHSAEVQLLQRRFVDTLLDKDMRFAPHTLREAVMLFDPLLIEIFYQDGWSKGMEALNTRIKETRNGLQRMEQIRVLKNCIKLAEDSGVPADELKSIRSNMAQQLAEIKSSDLLVKVPLYEDFFRPSTGLTQPITNQPALLTSEPVAAS